jgi:hypothetical protein
VVWHDDDIMMIVLVRVAALEGLDLVDLILNFFMAPDRDSL